MKTIHTSFIVSILILFMFLVSCTKNSETGTMTVKLTNSNSSGRNYEKIAIDQGTRSLPIDSILLDIRACEMHYSNPGPPSGWVALATYPGIYNLNAITADASIVLVNELTMPAGDVEQFRLILGPNNLIVIGGIAYPLKVPSGEQTGLKINLNESIHFVNFITVILDFDPNHQIVEQGNGGYILKPVIQVDVIYQN